MKKVECIVKSNKIQELQEALKFIGIRGMTVSEVKGFGNQQTRPEAYLFLPKTKIEIFAPDEDVEQIVQVISNICKTGMPGDGKIAIYDVQELIRIRTGERGEVAV